MTETAVGADLLQALEIVTELGSDTVGEDLAVLAIDDITLPVEEPGGDLVLQGVLDDGDETLKLFRGEVTSALAEIDVGLLADQVGVSATDTRDLGQGVHDLLLSIDVRVQQTDDVLEAMQSQHCLLWSCSSDCVDALSIECSRPLARRPDPHVDSMLVKFSSVVPWDTCIILPLFPFP